MVSLYAVQRRMPFILNIGNRYAVGSFARLIINWQSLCADVVAKLEWARSSKRVNLITNSLRINLYAGVATCPTLTPLPSPCLKRVAWGGGILCVPLSR